MTDFTKLSQEDLARVTTRDGQKVEIITTKGREPWPIVGYIGGGSDVRDWRASGAYINDISIENPADLILPPAPRVYYANAYPEGVVVVGHRSPSAARNAFSPGWLALYKITDDGVNATIEVIERNKVA